MSTHSSSVLGIDTHRHTQVAVILDGLGRHVSSLQIPATDVSAAELLTWSRAHGAPSTAGIEGPGSYGYQLTRALQAADINVVEVNRADRANRRRQDKNDPVDAEAAARAVLAGQSHCRPEGPRESSRTPAGVNDCPQQRDHGDHHRQHQIKALPVGADQDVRDRMRVLSRLRLAQRCSDLAPANGLHLA